MSDFGQKGILYNIIFLALEGFFYWFTTIALENNWMRRLKARRKNRQAATNQVKDKMRKFCASVRTNF